MKIKIYLLILSSLLLIGCSSPEEKAENFYKKNYNPELNDNIKLLASTSVYFYYSNPTNYWYPEEYTAKDILNDEWKHGFRALSTLEERTANLPNSNKEIAQAKNDLLQAISKTKKDIKKWQLALEQANGLFGLATYGGVEGLYALGSMFSTPEERAEADRKGRQMPVEVSNAFNNLKERLIDKYKATSIEMAELENNSLKNIEPTKEERINIREKYKAFIKNKFYNNFKEKDTVARNEMASQLLELYDNQNPVNQEQFSENYAQSQNKENEKETYNYCFQNIVKKDETGQTVYRFKFNLLNDDSVKGTFGYYPEYDYDLDWWEGDIQGTLSNGIIKGTYTFSSEGMNYIEPFEFKIQGDKATYKLAENYIYIDGVKTEAEQEIIKFDKTNCSEK